MLFCSTKLRAIIFIKKVPEKLFFHIKVNNVENNVLELSADDASLNCLKKASRWLLFNHLLIVVNLRLWF